MHFAFEPASVVKAKEPEKKAVEVKAPEVNAHEVKAAEVKTPEAARAEEAAKRMAVTAEEHEGSSRFRRGGRH